MGGEYKQNIEAELLAMIFTILGIVTVSFGLGWAVIFGIKWLIH